MTSAATLSHFGVDFHQHNMNKLAQGSYCIEIKVQMQPFGKQSNSTGFPHYIVLLLSSHLQFVLKRVPFSVPSINIGWRL